jgi:hypothetical protein
MSGAVKRQWGRLGVEEQAEGGLVREAVGNTLALRWAAWVAGGEDGARVVDELASGLAAKCEGYREALAAAGGVLDWGEAAEAAVQWAKVVGLGPGVQAVVNAVGQGRLEEAATLLHWVCVLAERAGVGVGLGSSALYAVGLLLAGHAGLRAAVARQVGYEQ